MPHTEETKSPSQQPEATNDPVPEFADDFHIVDAMKPLAATTTNNKPLRYGNRKKKAGEAGPNVKDLSSVSSFEEEEEIEMDDLPIRATAPEELIDKRSNPSEPREEYGERRPRRNDRSRGERSERQPRERAPRRPADPEASASETAETTDAPAAPATDRPERFGNVRAPAASANAEALEFRPSRDGKTAPKRERKPRGDSDAPSSRPIKAKKKGLLARIVAFFTGGDKEEEKKPLERDNRDGNRQRGGRGRRGPENRQPREGDSEEGEGGENRRRRRPRNRKPRPEGENGPRGEGRPPRGEGQNREGGERRRRPRRPRREGEGGQRRERRESPAE